MPDGACAIVALFCCCFRPPNVILVMPEKALKLTMNDVFRAQLRNLRTNKDLPLPLEMLAGGMAGFTQGQQQRPAHRIASYRSGSSQLQAWRSRPAPTYDADLFAHVRPLVTDDQ